MHYYKCQLGTLAYANGSPEVRTPPLPNDMIFTAHHVYQGTTNASSPSFTRQETVGTRAITCTVQLYSGSCNILIPL